MALGVAFVVSRSLWFDCDVHLHVIAVPFQGTMGYRTPLYSSQFPYQIQLEGVCDPHCTPTGSGPWHRKRCASPPAPWLVAEQAQSSSLHCRLCSSLPADGGVKSCTAAFSSAARGAPLRRCCGLRGCFSSAGALNEHAYAIPGPLDTIRQ